MSSDNGLMKIASPDILNALSGAERFYEIVSLKIPAMSDEELDALYQGLVTIKKLNWQLRCQIIAEKKGRRLEALAAMQSGVITDKQVGRVHKELAHEHGVSVATVKVESRIYNDVLVSSMLNTTNLKSRRWFEIAVNYQGGTGLSADEWVNRASTARAGNPEYMPKDLQKEMREEAWRLEREAALASIEELGQERQVDVVRDDCRDILAAWPLDRLFDCVIADPPYVEGPVQWKEFTLQWLSAVGGVLADDFHMFIFCPAGEAADYERLLWEEEWPVKSRIIWHWRNTPPQGETDRFLATYEVIFHVGTHDLNWQIASNEERFDVQTVSRPRPSQNDKGVHPEQKPLELITRLVEAGTKPGQNVLDPFAGSGTTGHACLALGDRRCTLVEIKDAYVEDIRYRLANINEA